MRSRYHLCDIEFHRPVIGVSGYLVRARYVAVYDVFQGLPRVRRTSDDSPVVLSLSLFLSPPFFQRGRSCARVRRVYRMSYHPAVPSTVSGYPTLVSRLIKRLTI